MVVDDDDDDGWLVPLGFYQPVELSISSISNHSSSFGWLHSCVCWFKSYICIYTHTICLRIYGNIGWKYYFPGLFLRGYTPNSWMEKNNMKVPSKMICIKWMNIVWWLDILWTYYWVNGFNGWYENSIPIIIDTTIDWWMTIRWILEINLSMWLGNIGWWLDRSVV